VELLINGYAQFIFRKFNLNTEKDLLRFEHFEVLVMDHPTVFMSYFEGFHNYAWATTESRIPEFVSRTCWIHSACVEYNEK
jgi:hypothetical protein